MTIVRYLQMFLEQFYIMKHDHDDGQHGRHLGNVSNVLFLYYKKFRDEHTKLTSYTNPSVTGSLWKEKNVIFKIYYCSDSIIICEKNIIHIILI